MTVRVGVVGLGMGRNHARGYHEAARAELAGLCDLNPALREEYGALYPEAKTYAEYEEMFATAGLDAVSIAVPNFLHAPIAMAALRAGLHVLCEKPMALNAAQAAEMLAVARAADKKLMIHFNYRFSPPSQFLKRYVDEGHLGQIYYARTRWLRARGIPGMGGWFGVKAKSGGGPLIDLGVHRLDLAMWLMGYPRAVSVGATLNLEVSWAGGTAKREDMETAVFGTDGAAIQRNRGEGYEFEALALQDTAGALSEVSPRFFPAQCPSAIDHFLDCIINDCPPEASAENGLEMMRIIDAIYRSAAEGREVRLDEG